MSSPFEFNVFDVGNPMALWMFEQDCYSDIQDLKFASCFRPVSVSEVQDILDTYHVRFNDLPMYIKEEISDIKFASPTEHPFRW